MTWFLTEIKVVVEVEILVHSRSSGKTWPDALTTLFLFVSYLSYMWVTVLHNGRLAFCTHSTLWRDAQGIAEPSLRKCCLRPQTTKTSAFFFDRAATVLTTQTHSRTNPWPRLSEDSEVIEYSVKRRPTAPSVIKHMQPQRCAYLHVIPESPKGAIYPALNNAWRGYIGLDPFVKTKTNERN